MIPTTNTRFGVTTTSPEGSVFRKDMVTEHWTTYPVRDMTRAEAEAVLARSLSTGSCYTFEIIDLDVQDQVRQIRNAASKAVLDATGYDDLTREGVDVEKRAAIRKVAIIAADHAEATARAQ